jgi:hypothetical protein
MSHTRSNPQTESVKQTLGSPVGPHSVAVRGTIVGGDHAGARSAWASYAVYIDAAPDVPVSVMPSATSPLGTTDQTASAWYSDPDIGDAGFIRFIVRNAAGQIVTPTGVPTTAAYTADGAPTPAGSETGVSTFNTALPPGTYTIQATAFDTWLASAPSPPATFVVASTAPVAVPTLPATTGRALSVRFDHPLPLALIRSALGAETRFAIEAARSAPDETAETASLGVAGDGGYAFTDAVDELLGTYGHVPIYYLQVKSSPSAVFVLPASLASHATAAAEAADGGDPYAEAADPSISHLTTFSSAPRAGARTWDPLEGKVEGYSTATRRIFNLSVKMGTVTDFPHALSTAAWEYDFKLYRADCGDPFWAIRSQFRAPLSWSTNLPGAYLDVNYGDACNWMDFTIGVYRSHRLVSGKTYWIKIKAPKGTGGQNHFQVQSEWHKNNCVIPSPWCVGLFDYDDVSSLRRLMVGRSTSAMMPGCRRWHRSYSSWDC